MRTPHVWLSSTVTALLVLTGAAQSAAGADAAGVPQGDSWDSIKRLPDWSGVWVNVSNGRHRVGEGKAPYKDLDLPFNEKGAAKFADLKKKNDTDVYFPSRMEKCLPLGIPGNIEEISTWQFLFTPGQVTAVGLQSTRKIYTDGRPHGTPSAMPPIGNLGNPGGRPPGGAPGGEPPQGLRGNPFANQATNTGDSIGHWEPGGVLVIDTVGLDPNNEIIIGMKQGKDVHVVERIHREGNRLYDDATVTASAIFATPWVNRAVYEHSDGRIGDYACSDNRITVDSKTGQPVFDISLPPDDD